jgi:hypothetical protein
MRTTCFAVLLFTVTFAFGDTNESNSIRVKHEWSLRNFVSPCGGTEPALIVNGHKYRDVMGSAPYYVAIPSSNMIYFVTSGKSYTSVCHFYDLGRKKDTKIVLNATELGNYVGKQDGRSVTIESITNSIALVACRYWNRTTVYNIDLNKRKLIATDTLLFGVRSNIVEQYRFLEKEK